MKTCILIPARNCAHLLPEVVRRLTLDAQDEIIVVDDASSDDTFAVAQALPRVAVYRNEVNLGYGGTSRRLYQAALQHGADYTINIHGDLGHDPEMATPVLARLKAGGCDMALGSRLEYLRKLWRERGAAGLFNIEERNGMPLVRVAGHFALTGFQNLLFGTRLYSFHEGLRGCTRAGVEWILQQDLPAWYNFDAVLLTTAARAGMSIAEVPIPPNYKAQAHSSAPPIRYGLQIVMDSIRLARTLR